MRLVLIIALGLCCVASVIAVDCEAFHVALRLHSVSSDEEIHSALMSRSESHSPLFRQHFSFTSLVSFVQAPPDAVNFVLNWLSHRHQIKNVSVGPTRDYIFFHWSGNLTVIGTLPQTLPRVGRASLTVNSEIASYVRSALVLCSDRKTRRRIRSKRATAGMNQFPLTITQRYGIPRSAIANAAPTVFQAVAEFEQEQFYQSNIDAFNSRFGFPNQTISVLGPNKGGYFGEGNLDLEYINTLASGVPTWWIAENEFDLVAWSQRVLTIQPPPSTLSISWGSGESGYDQQTVDAANAEFRKLGLLGLTVLAASGDQGTGSTGFFSCGTFDPTYPASSPYVTAVGGTYADSSATQEIGWTDSGGGFSTFFSLPSYQNATVRAYLANTTSLPSSQFFNSSGRGIPDVSAVACNFETYSSGWGVESGTSAATPTFASIITRINAERVAQGSSLLGFINPRLYELGRVGYDVVEGNNQNPSCPTGFPARVGWDPVTGLGTPQYTFLSKNL